MSTLTISRIQTNLSNFNFNSGATLKALTEADRKVLEQYAKVVMLPRKQVLYSEGEPTKGIYVLLSGKIKISQLNFDGSVQILFIFSTGEIFGHRPILGNDRQPVTATALEDCELLFIEKEHFLQLLNNSTDFSQLLMKSMSHEFTVLVNRINVFAQKGIKERLALFLLLLNETFKVPNQFAEAAEITLNRNDLAAYTGTSVENLVRTLKVFKESGYIRVNGKSIIIENFDALYSMTGI